MGKMTKYSDLKADDIFKWGQSVYVWLGDNFNSVMCIKSPFDNKRNVFPNALNKYDADDNENEWEVIGRMIETAYPEQEHSIVAEGFKFKIGDEVMVDMTGPNGFYRERASVIEILDKKDGHAFPYRVRVYSCASTPLCYEHELTAAK